MRKEERGKSAKRDIYSDRQLNYDEANITILNERTTCLRKRHPFHTPVQFSCASGVTFPHPIMSQRSYAIIGAGVFGASTALQLIRKYPSATITLIDQRPFPCEVGASWDLNKVVRADYTEILYMKLAIEAKNIWMNDPLYQKWYHPDGMYWISDTDLAKTVAGLYEELGAKEDYELVDPATGKQRYQGMFADGDYQNVSQVLINKSSGWAEAKNALSDVIQAAVDLGVTYLASAVTSLKFDASGSCTGALTIDGQSIDATRIVLCTGAATARLLADSAPDRDELQVGGRMMAAGICTGVINMTIEQAEQFQGPVCCQDVLPGRGKSSLATHSSSLAILSLTMSQAAASPLLPRGN